MVDFFQILSQSESNSNRMNWLKTYLRIIFHQFFSDFKFVLENIFLPYSVKEICFRKIFDFECILKVVCDMFRKVA